jgi:hypothetical protein
MTFGQFGGKLNYNKIYRFRSWQFEKRKLLFSYWRRNANLAAELKKELKIKASR